MLFPVKATPPGGNVLIVEAYLVGSLQADGRHNNNNIIFNVLFPSKEGGGG